MADQGKWFKLWVNSRRDPDLGSLPLEQWARWCLLGIYLKENGNDGMISLLAPAKPLQVAMELDNYQDLLKTLKMFPNCAVGEKQVSTVSLETNAIVSLTITWENWLKYQGDFSTERVRTYRNKMRMMKRTKKRGEEKRQEEKEKRKRFIPPTPQEISVYAKEINCRIDPKRFFDYYESKGWLVGKAPMRDWKASLRMWKSKDEEEHGTNDSASSVDLKAESRAARAAKKAREDATAGTLPAGVRDIAIVPEGEGRGSAGGSNQ